MKILKNFYILLPFVFFAVLFSACWDKGILKTIEIKNLPNTTIFALNNPVDLTGLTLNVTYSAARETINIQNKNLNISEVDNTIPGKQKIFISYTYKNKTETIPLEIEFQEAVCSINNFEYPTLQTAVNTIDKKSTETITILNKEIDNKFLKASYQDKSVIINDTRTLINTYPEIEVNNGNYLYQSFFNLNNISKQKISISLCNGVFTVNNVGIIQLKESKGFVIIDSVKDIILGSEKTPKNNGEIKIINSNDITILSPCNKVEIYNFKEKNILTNQLKKINLKENSNIKTFEVYNNSYISDNNKNIFVSSNNIFTKDIYSPEGYVLDFLKNIDQYECNSNEINLKINHDMLYITGKEISEIIEIKLLKNNEYVFLIYLTKNEENKINQVILQNFSS